MAITYTPRGDNAVSAASAAVSAFSPAAGSTLLAWVESRGNNTINAPTIGGGGTWTERDSHTANDGTRYKHLKLFSSVADGSSITPATGSPGGGAGGWAFIMVIEAASSDGTTFANVAHGDSNLGDPSCSLGTTTAGNSVVGGGFCYKTASPAAVGPTTGYVDLVDKALTGITTERAYICESNGSPPNTTCGVTSTNTLSLIIAIELVAAAAAGSLILPPALSPAMLSMLQR